MKIDYKRLIKFILIPLILGGLVGFLSGSSSGYKEMITPSFAPPGILFPIVWSILYIIMGVSRYIIDGEHECIRIYNIQLIFNLLWSFVFFTFKLYLIAFIWIVVLIILVLIMMIKFYKKSKVSSLIQIPYLIWLIFASVLSYSIYILN
jgi:tryptophan-rich sensory protein